MRLFESIGVGHSVVLGDYTFTAESIKAFAGRFDPQPFHLDEAAGARSHFGALCASGWQTACVWMRLMVDHRKREDEECRARGEPVAELGPSPGFRELRWLRPVYAGDTIRYSTEVLDKRILSTRPGWGIIFMRNTGVNQHGEPVISFISSAFVARRPAETEPRPA
ncbi:MAG: MaoC family dehydratase [Xanthobacteraceae bacterium]